MQCLFVVFSSGYESTYDAAAPSQWDNIIQPNGRGKFSMCVEKDESISSEVRNLSFKLILGGILSVSVTVLLL